MAHDERRGQSPIRMAYLFQNANAIFHKPGAPELHILHTIRGMQERGHEAHLLALQPKRWFLFSNDLEAITSGSQAAFHPIRAGLSGSAAFRLVESGIRFAQTRVRFPYLGLFDDFRMYETSAALLQGFDLIHERYNGAVYGGLLASKKLKIPYILETNADMFEQKRSQGTQLRGLQEWKAIRHARYSYAQATRIICVSDELRDHLIEEWEVPAEKAVVLPCAADVHLFGKPYDTARVRAELGVDGSPVVMWVGGFFLWHNLPFLLRGFCRVLQSAPDAKLVLIGDGRTKDAVEAEIRSLGIGNSVILTGRIPYERVPEYIAAADVTVSASEYFPGFGGTPLKLFEYMAAGKAIVAVRMSQAAAVIDDRVNGVLIDPGDLEGFAAAIAELIHDPQERDRLGRNARQRAVEKHSWEHYAQALEEIYCETLDSFSAGSLK